MIKDISEFQKQIKTFNLERLEAELMKLVKPCVHIMRTPLNDLDTLPIGASRLGGNPDLPDGFSWSFYKHDPLTFIAQFRLSEIAPYDPDSLLPSRGLLYFFFLKDSLLWGNYEDRDRWSVVYIENEDIKLIRTPHPIVEAELTHIDSLPAHKITLLSRLSLPILQYGEDQYFDLNFESDEELEAYWKLQKSLLPEPEVRHQILGYPICIQHHVEWECVLNSQPEDKRERLQEDLNKVENRYRAMQDWQFLFQIDTDDSLKVMWGDVGTLYVCIPKVSLTQGHFEDCWMILQSN